MRSVLIVDDEEAVRAALGAALDALGAFSVSVAPDGASGLAAMSKLRPDVVFIDLVLPDTGGLQFIRAMSEVKGYRRPGRVVLMTAHPDPLPRESLADIGADALLPKPFRLRDVSVALATVAAPMQ